VAIWSAAECCWKCIPFGLPKVTNGSEEAIVRERAFQEIGGILNALTDSVVFANTREYTTSLARAPSASLATDSDPNLISVTDGCLVSSQSSVPSATVHAVTSGELPIRRTVVRSSQPTVGLDAAPQSRITPSSSRATHVFHDPGDHRCAAPAPTSPTLHSLSQVSKTTRRPLEPRLRPRNVSFLDLFAQFAPGT